MSLSEAVELVASAVEVMGVGVIVGGIAWITVLAVSRIRVQPPETLFRGYRRGIGRAILLGLEVLIAADIIRTVALAPTFEGVAVLGLIVLIRTFLSFSLEAELYGRWPWQRGPEAAGQRSAS